MNYFFLITIVVVSAATSGDVGGIDANAAAFAAAAEESAFPTVGTNLIDGGNRGGSQRAAFSLLIAIVLAAYFFFPSDDKSGGDAKTAGNENDGGCNDPNCLRCHSDARCHVEELRRNAVLLHRLVKLEPHLFEGLRGGIWDAVAAKINGGGAEKSELGTETDDDRKNRGGDDCRVGGDNDDVGVFPPSSHPGQRPTVFFLPGLAAAPFHERGCAASCAPLSTACPCEKLWDDGGDLAALEEHASVIREELLAVLSSESAAATAAASSDRGDDRGEDSSSPTSSSGEGSDAKADKLFVPFDPAVSTGSGTWSAIYLYRNGVRQSDACDRRFPRTANVIETLCPHRMAGRCGLGSVYVSRLDPDTEVKPHCGPTNVRWRCHLPLVVPPTIEPSSSGRDGARRRRSELRVGLPDANERSVGWEEGKIILFDDSFVHSAIHADIETSDFSNGTGGGDSDGVGVGDGIRESTDGGCDGSRIVLIVDFWHPSLTEADRIALGVLYPPGS